MCAADHRDLALELSINTFLIDSGSQLVLIEAGAGDLFAPEAGLLSSNLRRAGVDPARIGAVVLTHIHADHSGGLMKGGAKVFPNAKVYVPERDYQLFMNKDAEAKAPEKQKHIYSDARKCIGPYADAGKVKTYSWDAEVVPVLEARPRPVIPRVIAI